MRAALAAVCLLGGLSVAAAQGETVTVGAGGWEVQSSAAVSQSGAEVSTPGFPADTWLAVKPDDAGAVGTEIAAQLQNGVCPEVFFAENMKSCFGYLSSIGPRGGRGRGPAGPLERKRHNPLARRIGDSHRGLPRREPRGQAARRHRLGLERFDDRHAGALRL
jgi:hypothetical protein